MKRLLFIVLIALTAGCSKDSDKSKDDVEVPPIEYRQGKAKIMPLAAGATWVYQIEALDTTQNILRPIKVDSFMILRDTLIQNVRWYEFDGLGPDRGFAINWDDGLWMVRPPDSPFIFVKYPAVIGDTFTSVIGKVETKNRVVATDLEVTVPAGVFHCYKYEQKVGPIPMTTNFYFAPGAGLIKMEIMDRNGARPMGQAYLVAMKAR